MVEISYNMVVRVTRSWDVVRRIPNYLGIMGEMIFIRMAELDPRALKIFNFEVGEDFRANPQFETRSRVMVDMVDMAVGFLGPDLEPLEDDLKALGVRHIKYGVEPEYLPLMTKSLLFSLHKVLKEKLTAADVLAWETVFDFLVLHMTKGMEGDYKTCEVGARCGVNTAV